MKYAIFSDVHSNEEAFNAVLEVFRQESVDRCLFLGDIVGYGANPQECLRHLVELIRVPGCLCVAGNHDYAVCGLSSVRFFTRYAREAVEWTRNQLSKTDLEFLRQMKMIQVEGNFTIVHANLENPSGWGYILDVDDARSNFRLLEKQICFIGHSHKPAVYIADKNVIRTVRHPDEKIQIEADSRYIINVGSVGQPRDGDSRASFAVYDTERERVEIKRVAYDISAAQGKILKAGLPVFLAGRLGSGK